MYHRTTRSGCRIYRAISRQADAFPVSCGTYRLTVDTVEASACWEQEANPCSLRIQDKETSFLIHPHKHFDPLREAKKIKNDCNCLVNVSVKDLVENGYTRSHGGTMSPTTMLSISGSRTGRKKSGYENFRPDIVIDETLALEDQGLAVNATAGHSPVLVNAIADNALAITRNTQIG
ncbi:MAG: hypothetical protein NTU98_08995 [Bacteroidetes bacterium]|nr:hypothetical protein [Bacteroidota bacterium]